MRFLNSPSTIGKIVLHNLSFNSREFYSHLLIILHKNIVVWYGLQNIY